MCSLICVAQMEFESNGVFFLGERGKPYVHEKEASLCKLKKVKPQHSLGSSPGQICERRALSISFLTCKTKRT